MKKISPKLIEKMIFVVRSQKVMLDSDLAELYEVDTKVLNQAVKRNIKRFPSDFMFQLSKQEFTNLKSQFVTSSLHGGRRKLPLAFTESGVAMLSGILNSDRAISVNIAIMRTFTKIREFLANDESLSSRMQKLEKGTDKLFRIVFERLDNLEIEAPTLPRKRKRIGLKK
ncbi:MAG: ORF6N domain-containing protein [Epsilonproteobacteria bacterium]|nr:MAG: ORF6N domain-containing protein [Campylobacterota bacterium]RLA65811.1 MAG: ORF6N domain-containing protein [Campylobacterota bacterium]